MAGLIDCYINGQVVCKAKNGEPVSCEVADAIVAFKCNMLNNPMSNTVFLDLRDSKTVNITIK